MLGLHVTLSGWFYRVPDDSVRQETEELHCHADKLYILHISTASWCPGSTPTAPRARDYPVHELFQRHNPGTILVYPEYYRGDGTPLSVTNNGKCVDYGTATYCTTTTTTTAAAILLL